MNEETALGLDNLTDDLKINKVMSKEYKERQGSYSSSYNLGLTNSLYVKTTVDTRGLRKSDFLTTSTARPDKPIGYGYNNPRESREPYTTNLSFNSKGTLGNRFNYGVYKRDANDMAPRYANDKDSENGSADREGPSYKRIEDLGITPNMVSSVISRESEGKAGGNRSSNKLGSKGKLQEEAIDEAYQMYSSRHPTESIRKSTI
jgi:hypothetical protein